MNSAAKGNDSSVTCCDLAIIHTQELGKTDLTTMKFMSSYYYTFAVHLVVALSTICVHELLVLLVS
jgi:hypothetical protein